MFENYKVFKYEFAGRPLVVETGKVAGLANGSCLIRYGDTVILATATASAKPRDGIDFLPLSVDFEAEKIEACRSKRKDYVSPSFETIAGFNENAALPHYQATKAAHSIIKKNGILLIDTGGQYFRGTTDMTRVIPVGEPSKAQKHDFTIVLKSVIALSTTHFPRSISSALIDSIARKPLWDQGYDFGHGTGHGVGYFLNVHEGPQGISYRGSTMPQTSMEEGMVTSIEPGLYRAGKWGIRIENLSAAVFAEKTPFGDFLKFETLTQCPIDTRCIEYALLTESEKTWLNHYHAGVREKLLPRIADEAKDWLITRTEPI